MESSYTFFLIQKPNTKNITKTYKKIPTQTASSIENRSKSITNKLNLTDRINTTAERVVFITLKDHQPYLPFYQPS